MDQSTLRSMRTRRRRRPRQMAVAATLLGALTASALVASATEPSTFDDKTIVVIELAALKDFDSHDQKKLDKALSNLYKGLADESWAVDGNSLARKGERVFKYDARAIRDLQKIDDPAVGALVLAIVEIDFQLVEAAIDAAAITGADTAKAGASMIKAEEALARGDIHKAVDALGKAWKDAVHAKPPKGSAAGSSSGGKYSVYDVVFVRTDTAGTASPVFLSVSGSNEPGSAGDSGSGNEGYLFSSEFGPGETFLDPALWPTADGGIMQLHVSCSDVFPGGMGAKSDPAATSQWLVNSFHIVKYKDGVIEKECDVIGAGLPTAATSAVTTATTSPPTTTTSTTTTMPPTTTTEAPQPTTPPPATVNWWDIWDM